MLYIYKFTNTENGKTYIGQTNNFELRINGHRSTAFNPNSKDYNGVFYQAIRKYGWGKFKFEILEEIFDEEGREYLNERERFFIEHYQSLTSQSGYNVSIGGQNGGLTVKKTFEELLETSKIFTKEELLDIITMLRNQIRFKAIYQKYPNLKQTFLSNINNGYNFKNPEWTYPLCKHTRSQFSEEEIQQIKEEIKKGDKYQDIAERWGIKSIGYISMINAGKYFFNEAEDYPLCKIKKGGPKVKQPSKVTTLTPAFNTKSFLIWSDFTEKEIQKIIGYAEKRTVERINFGFTHKEDRLFYPLNQNQEKNQKLFKTNVVSTISG